VKLSIRLLALALLFVISGCSGVALSWDQYSPNLGADDSVTSYQWTPDGYRTNR
jgi:ABC-type glycerol-3-phosphate transport system substrate-binding protein